MSRPGFVLEVDDRRQRAFFERHRADEVERLLCARAAQSEEVIRAASDASSPCLAPVTLKCRIDEVASFGCLDIGEVDALVREERPFDRALVMRHVNALERIRDVARMP